MSKTCLIAEHDPWDLQLLRLHAERLGFCVVHVYQTQDIVPTAQQVRPDILILEKELPGMIDCQDIICVLQSNPSTRHVTVLLLLDESQRLAAPDGSDHVYHLQKPPTYETLCAVLEQADVISAGH